MRDIPPPHRQRIELVPLIRLHPHWFLRNLPPLRHPAASDGSPDQTCRILENCFEHPLPSSGNGRIRPFATTKAGGFPVFG
jgi:hypothetical protein